MDLIISLLPVTAPDSFFLPAAAAEPGTGVMRLTAPQGGAGWGRHMEPSAPSSEQAVWVPPVRGASKSMFPGLSGR